MTHFSLLQRPEIQQESGSTLSSQMSKALKSFSILYRKVSFCPSLPLCFKASSSNIGYLSSLPMQLERINQKGKKKLLRGVT